MWLLLPSLQGLREIIICASSHKMKVDTLAKERGDCHKVDRNYHEVGMKVPDLSQRGMNLRMAGSTRTNLTATGVHPSHAESGIAGPMHTSHALVQEQSTIPVPVQTIKQQLSLLVRRLWREPPSKHLRNSISSPVAGFRISR